MRSFPARAMRAAILLLAGACWAHMAVSDAAAQASVGPGGDHLIRIGILSHRPVEEIQGQLLPLFGGVIVVRADRADLQDLSDLSGSRIAAVDPQSLGGYRMQLFELHANHLPLPGRQRVSFTDMPHDRVVEAVLGGSADAGFVRTGIIEQMAAGGRLDLAEIRVLNPQEVPGFPLALSTRLYPQWALAAMPGLRVETANRITAALLTLALPAERDVGAAGLGFTVAVDYRAVEDLARELRLPPFEEIPRVTWREFVASHPVASAGFAVMVLGLVALSLLLGFARRRLQESSARFAAVFQQSPIGILVHDAETGEILDASPQAWKDYGYASREDLIANQAATWQTEGPYTLSEAMVRLQRAASGERLNFDWPVLKADGSTMWLRVTLAPVMLAKTVRVLALCVDSTEQRLFEQRLKDSELRFRSLLDDIEGVAVQGYGLDGKVHYWNRGSELLYGYTREEALGGNLLELIIPEQMRPEVSQSLARVAEGGSIGNEELELVGKDGRPVPAYSSHTVVRSPGKAPELFCLDIDLTERKQHEKDLLQAAHYDGLTGLPNRTLLAELMRQAFAQADRQESVLALCYLDLDGFKSINDRHGTAVGDEVLIRVGKRLRRLVRGSDVVARLGGDEFVLLLEGLGKQGVLQERLRFLLKGVARPMNFDGQLLQVRASVGVTLYPQDANDPDVLLRHANAAMLDAKEKGRHRFSVFDTQLERDLEQRRARLEEIEQAMADEQFVLYYQPKVNMATGELVGLEGLARWQHPDKGLLPPPAFLDYLDGSELEHGFGEYVIRQALAQLQRWNESGQDRRVSVNLTGSHLLSPTFIERLSTLLDEFPAVSPSQLELEILESATLADIDQTVKVLSHCRGMGIRVALDDFGTGYSSLSRLRSLPVSILKIDQSFVRHMLTDLGDYSIVKSVIGLAKAFDLEVIAEGVETDEHAVTLLLLGCGQGQGFGLGKPMPAQDVAAWFDQWQQNAPWLQFGAQRMSAGKSGLAVAMRTHEAWLERVLQAVDGDSDGEPAEKIGDHLRSSLGLWLRDEGSRLFTANARFPSVVDRHMEVHNLALRLHHARTRNDPAAAELEQKLLDVSAELTDLISHLQD